jgi:hypothetical protein
MPIAAAIAPKRRSIDMAEETVLSIEKLNVA